eukprot:GEMP01054428.1.p1 GENE.GEMP01054428.1~~GEMP01054428.1.p1  ORF type:complete len:264 (+),score=38.20 GEMP01054428.1:11-802(+)
MGYEGIVRSKQLIISPDRGALVKVSTSQKKMSLEVVAAGVTATATIVAALKTLLTQQLSEVVIIREEVDSGKKALNQMKLETWDEQNLHSTRVGMPVERLVYFASQIADFFRIRDDSMRDIIRTEITEMEWLDQMVTQHLELHICQAPEEPTVSNRMDSSYGFVAMMKNADGKFSACYAIHQASFTVSDREFAVVKQKKCFFKRVKVGDATVDKEKESYKFNTDDIDFIKHGVIKELALKSFVNMGLIQELKYRGDERNAVAA